MGDSWQQLVGRPASGVVGVVVLLLVAISLGTGIRFWALRHADRDVAEKRLASLKTWWVLVVLLAAATLLGRLGATLLFALASALALSEFVRLARPAVAARATVLWAFGLLAVNYALVLGGQQTAWLVWLPVAAGLLLSGRFVLAGQPQDYIRTIGSLYWGLIVLGYFLSHAPALFLLPAHTNPVAGGAGWFLYLVVLTEMNDIAQALVGRRFGQHRITPVVSPHKTWEGFLGGVVITVVLALVLAPWLTPWWASAAGGQASQPAIADSLPDHSSTPGRSAPANASSPDPDHAMACPPMVRRLSPIVWAGMAGLLVSVCGFFGDINMSAVKRDVGVKDSSTLLPGQGGVIDRIDALTFTSVAFYYYVQWICP